MNNKLIQKFQKGGIESLKDPLAQRDKKYVRWLDDNTIEYGKGLNQLPEITVYPDKVHTNNIGQNLYQLKQKGYHNLASKVADVYNTAGSNAAYGFLFDSTDRIKDLLKSSHIESVTSLKKGAVDATKAAINAAKDGADLVANTTADIVFNAPDYIDYGLAYLAGLIPGGLTPEESVELAMIEKSTPQGEFYYDAHGNRYVKPYTLEAPILPGLPPKANSTVFDLYKQLKKLRTNWIVRENLLKKAGKVEDMYKTLTAKRYREAEKTFKDAISSVKHSSEYTPKLTKRGTSAYKAEKARVTNDLRSANQGRPVMRERQWAEVEHMMRADKNPEVKSILNKFDIKVAKGINSDALKKARKDMLLWYLTKRPGFFDFLKK